MYFDSNFYIWRKKSIASVWIGRVTCMAHDLNNGRERGQNVIKAIAEISQDEKTCLTKVQPSFTTVLQLFNY